MTAASGARPGSPHGAATRADLNSRWWRAFGDPLLDRLVERAAHDNLDVQAAVLRIARPRSTMRRRPGRARRRSRAIVTGRGAPFLDVLDAQWQWSAGRRQAVQGALQMTTDLVALYKALSGGWQAGSTPGANPDALGATLPTPSPADATRAQ